VNFPNVAAAIADINVNVHSYVLCDSLVVVLGTPNIARGAVVEVVTASKHGGRGRRLFVATKRFKVNASKRDATKQSNMNSSRPNSSRLHLDSVKMVCKQQERPSLRDMYFLCLCVLSSKIDVHVFRHRQFPRCYTHDGVPAVNWIASILA
jgi:hypothetical protein